MRRNRMQQGGEAGTDCRQRGKTLFRNEITLETVQRGRETAEEYDGNKPYKANVK